MPPSPALPEVIVVDDDPVALGCLQNALGNDYLVHCCVSPKSAEPAMARTTDREPVAPSAATLEETSRLDMPPEVADPSPTRRKTIRVKRPTQRPGVAAAPGGAGAPGAVPAISARRGAPAARTPAPVKPDQMNATFPVFAIITLIVILVTIYVFCSQTLGPNVSYTQHSYYKEGPNLGWVGKIPFSHQ